MSDVICKHGQQSRGCQICIDDKFVLPSPQVLIAGSVNPVEVTFQDTGLYEVIALPPSKHAGLRLGVVRHHAKGWRFIPTFQALPSRKFHQTADGAVKGRIRCAYELWPLPSRGVKE